MKKLLIIISTLVALAGMAAGGVVALQPAPDTTEPIWNSCYSGTSSGCDQIYTDEITGGTRYRFIDDLKTPIVDRAATVGEVTIYADYVLQVGKDAAEISLAAEVDTGQKWVAKLREWELDAQNYYGQWPSMSDAAKDSVTREMVRRMGLTWGGLADLLTVLDKGR